MSSFKGLFILSVLILICWRSYVSAQDLKPQEYKSSGGGGECDTDLDCSNQGRCVNEKGGKAADGEEEEINGKCLCNNGRDGEHCEKEDESTTRRGKVYGRKKNEDKGVKRQLKTDSDVKATCLDPEELKTNDQVFLIYCPRTARYVKVGSGSPKTGAEKSNKYLVTDEDFRGEAKLFKLESAGGDQYYIAAMDNDGANVVGYIYVSDITKGVKKKSNRVMKSSDKSDKENYKFTFAKHYEQKGVYKIKCKGLTLYGSVGGFNVKADNRGDREKSEEIWFQFNLKPDSDIKVEKGDKKENALEQDDDLEVENEEIENDTKKDQKFTLNKEKTISKVLTKLDKTVFGGTAGVKAGAVGNIGLSVSKEKSTTKQYTLTKVNKDNIEITIEASTKVCIEYTFRKRGKFDEQELSIDFKGKKFKGYKLEESKTFGDVTMKLKQVGVGEKCK